MKTNIVLVFFICFSFLAKAQGLQFSQVLAPQLTIPATVGSITPLGTVPAGKVWKIENYICYYISTNYYALVVNGATATPYVLPNSTSGNWFFNNNSFWFPEGTTLAIRRNSGSTTESILFNILEFTVTP